MSNEPSRDISAIFDDDEAIDQALAAAARDARRHHKLVGNPIAAMRDGKIVWIPPEEIQVDEDRETPPRAE